LQINLGLDVSMKVSVAAAAVKNPDMLSFPELGGNLINHLLYAIHRRAYIIGIYKMACVLIERIKVALDLGERQLLFLYIG
jgi:hypothetical protein